MLELIDSRALSCRVWYSSSEKNFPCEKETKETKRKKNLIKKFITKDIKN